MAARELQQTATNLRHHIASTIAIIILTTIITWRGKRRRFVNQPIIYSIPHILSRGIVSRGRGTHGRDRISVYKIYILISLQ